MLIKLEMETSSDGCVSKGLLHCHVQIDPV